MKIIFGICCVIALGKAFPTNDSVKFYSTGPQPTDKLNSNILHKRIARQIDEYKVGSYTYPAPSELDY